MNQFPIGRVTIICDRPSLKQVLITTCLLRSSVLMARCVRDTRSSVGLMVMNVLMTRATVTIPASAPKIAPGGQIYSWLEAVPMCLSVEKPVRGVGHQQEPPKLWLAVACLSVIRSQPLSFGKQSAVPTGKHS